MKLHKWMTVGLVAASVGVMSVGSGWAQPQPNHRDDDDNRGVATHRQGFRLVDPRGQQVNDNQAQFRFVIPGVGQSGTYYTNQNSHYYTPVQPPRRSGRSPGVQNPVKLEFGAFRHHEELAARLETLTRELCLDLHHNYQGNRGFDDVYGEAYRLMQAAKSLHSNEHRGDHKAMQRIAPRFDSLFHHVQRELHGWRSGDHRNIGQMNTHARMEEMEAVIHHLMYDLGVKPDHDHDHHDGDRNDRNDRDRNDRDRNDRDDRNDLGPKRQRP